MKECSQKGSNGWHIHTSAEHVHTSSRACTYFGEWLPLNRASLSAKVPLTSKKMSHLARCYVLEKSGKYDTFVTLLHCTMGHLILKFYNILCIFVDFLCISRYLEIECTLFIASPPFLKIDDITQLKNKKKDSHKPK